MRSFINYYLLLVALPGHLVHPNPYLLFGHYYLPVWLFNKVGNFLGDSLQFIELNYWPFCVILISIMFRLSALQ